MKRSLRIGGALVLAVALLLFLLLRGRDEDGRKGDPREPTATVQAQGSGGSNRAVSKPVRTGRVAAPLAKLSLRGVVLDRAGAPIANATVVLAAPRRLVRTAPNGRFEITELLPGRYTLEARQGSLSAGPIGVVLAPSTRDIVLRLYQGFALEVEVVAADTGQPIAGAEVEVSLISMYPGAGRQHARTAANGVASLEGLTFIGHDLRVAAPGFADERRGPGPDLTERAPGVRRIRVGLHRTALELVGKLVDDRGAPVPGGEVEVVNYQPQDRSVDEVATASSYGAVDPHAALRSGMGTRSDAAGAFRIGLEAGTWVVIASAPDRELTVSEPIFVEAGGPKRKELTLVLGAGRTVRGVVVDAADHEVAAAQVEARWLDGTRVLGTTVSDGGGSFEIRGLPAAPIELIARSNAGRSRPFPVDLVPGNVDGAVVSLDLGGTITGRVLDDRGTPVPDAVITYLEQQARAKVSLYPDIIGADDEGRFTIAGVAPGVTYFLSGARPQDGNFGQHAAGITARAGDTVTITIPAGGAIVGRIVGAADPRQVMVRDAQTLTAARPDREGRFRLDKLPALRYQLHVSGPSIADVYVESVEVSANRDTDVGDVVVEAGRKVAGVVVDASGKPLDSAIVRIEVDNRYAVVTRAIAGKFSKTVVSNAGLSITATHLQAGHTSPLAIGPSSSTSSLRLAMLPGEAIRGHATSRGSALARAPVTVWPVGPRPPEPTGVAMTDDAGAFTIPAVPAGRWFVECGIPALEREHRVLQQTVEVVLGTPIDLVFDATEAPRGTIVQPRPATVDLPVHGDDESHEN